MKERQVYWFLFPISGLICALLFYNNTLPELFYLSVTFNFIFIFLLILVLNFYVKFKLKTTILKAIGLGDLLLFGSLSLSFSTISFIIIFISSLIFSLVLHLASSKNQKLLHVPLAGYMSLFFLITYLIHWSGYVSLVYTI
ncbi:hypothetical protein [uncultured Algibacter sp.]|uniref:hypothetical protein n=1 Tax=uncultured Algibacter sp. TaxID=298659 RepID=UPI00262EE9E5|nr:hypothetical protein [uncultured Algibacter sp.]